MDGFELIDRVRTNQLHAGMPIVVITAPPTRMFPIACASAA